MGIFFARLDGDINGIDRYCRFEADNFEEAQEIGDMYAEQNYSEYGEAFDEENEPLFYSIVEPWSDETHAGYIGDACFTDYTIQ